MSYRAPTGDMVFALRVAGFDRLLADGLFPDFDAQACKAVLDEAGRFAEEVLTPLNAPADREGARLEGDAVATPLGFRQAYRRWAEGGWAGAGAPAADGGMGLPVMLAAALEETWNGACMAFGLGPVLTAGAADALAEHASEDLKRLYLAPLIEGRWAGTMNLTEPQAGSDLGALAARAAPAEDGAYRLSGTKIYITYGEHDLTENIVHLVLARLPDAPAGTKGISLFLVPKFLARADGSPGARNDVRCVGIERKLGLHASPTCTMVFGEAGGATAFLVGEPHRGLAAMFTMMNRARLATGLQGVGIAERAFQLALGHAVQRRQGRAVGWAGEGASPIVHHPDVRRMLLTMRALTQAARCVCYACAEALDRARHDPDPERRRAARERADLVTPVAKAFSSDVGVEVASLGIQVHGGMGYVEETGAAQLLRDARIVPIYEGTNGIQAIDLATRKLPRGQGAVARAHIAGLRETAEAARASNLPGLAETGRHLAEAVDALEAASEWIVTRLASAPQAVLAGAAAYLRLFALATGGAGLARGALMAGKGEDAAESMLLARHFALVHLAEARGLAAAVMSGGVDGADADALFARLSGH